MQTATAAGTGHAQLGAYVLPSNILHDITVELRACWMANAGPNGNTVGKNQ